MIGRSQSAVSQIEHGEIGLSLDLLRQIVAQLGGEVEITAVFNDRRVLPDARSLRACRDHRGRRRGRAVITGMLDDPGELGAPAERSEDYRSLWTDIETTLEHSRSDKAAAPGCRESG